MAIKKSVAGRLKVIYDPHIAQWQAGFFCRVRCLCVSHTDPHSGRKKSIHFACQFEALGSGISRIQKQFQNPEALSFLELFLDSRYSTSNCLKLARKVNQLCPAGLCEDLCVGERGGGLVRSILTCCHPEYTKTPSTLGECSYFLIEKVL